MEPWKARLVETGNPAREGRNPVPFRGTGMMSNLIYAHLYEYLLEVEQAETHTCLNSTERNLRSLGNFCMGPSLKIC